MARQLRIAAADGERRSGPCRVMSDTQWGSIGKRLDLSPRELQIVRGIFNSSKETAIAHELGIAPCTVHAHAKRIYQKLGVHDHAEVIVRVFEEYASLVGSGDA